VGEGGGGGKEEVGLRTGRWGDGELCAAHSSGPDNLPLPTALQCVFAPIACVVVVVVMVVCMCVCVRNNCGAELQSSRPGAHHPDAAPFTAVILKMTMRGAQVVRGFTGVMSLMSWAIGCMGGGVGGVREGRQALE
jgi:hypothetical protein